MLGHGLYRRQCPWPKPTKNFFLFTKRSLPFPLSRAMLRYSTAPWQSRRMNRRALLTGLSFTLALPRFARAADFSAFLAALQARAAAEGIPPSVIAAATGHLVPNQTVLRLDHHQPEFTETWAVYSSHVLSQTRIEAGARKSERGAGAVCGGDQPLRRFRSALARHLGDRDQLRRRPGRFRRGRRADHARLGPQQLIISAVR